MGFASIAVLAAAVAIWPSSARYAPDPIAAEAAAIEQANARAQTEREAEETARERAEAEARATETLRNRDPTKLIPPLAGALEEDTCTALLSQAGFTGVGVEVTRVYEQHQTADGRLVSAFVRATKPDARSGR